MKVLTLWSKGFCKHLLNNKTDATNLVFKLTLIFTNIANLLHFKVLQYTKRVRKEKFRNHCRISMAIQKKLFNVTPFSWFNLLIFDDLCKVVKTFWCFFRLNVIQFSTTLGPLLPFYLLLGRERTLPSFLSFDIHSIQKLRNQIC